MNISDLNKEIVEHELIPDKIGIEKIFVEGYFCPKCYRNFVYCGFRFPDDNTICYGVCDFCNKVRKFYFNSQPVADGKRKFSKVREQGM